MGSEDDGPDTDTGKSLLDHGNDPVFDSGSRGEGIDNTDAVESRPEIGADHNSIIVIGRSGSGKSVLMRWWGKRSPYALFVNTQRNRLPGWTEVLLNEWKQGLIEHRHAYINPPVEMDIDKFVNEYYSWALQHPGTMLLVDEATIWGSRSKNSQSGWATTMMTRSRTAFHSVVSWHSSHQANNVLLMNARWICFFDSGQSMEIERDYLEKYFRPLVEDDCMKHLKKPYHWILYDVRNDEYLLCDPVDC